MTDTNSAPKPVMVIARYRARISIPAPPDMAKRELWRSFGYEDGIVNHEPVTPDEPLEYGLAIGSLVPVKWPKPAGLEEASWSVHAGVTQEITIELMSDGTRRVAKDQSHG